jgi:dTDP-4-dehydrorhamnose 3,5-epimerase-like enzyme
VVDGIINHKLSTTPKTLEGRAVSMADRIAYINHDIDDAIKGGFITQNDLPKDAVELLGKTSRDRINTMLLSIYNESDGKNKVEMQPHVKEATEDLRNFLFANVYNDKTLRNEEMRADRMITALYEYYTKSPQKLPEFYIKRLDIDGIDTVLCEGGKFCAAPITHKVTLGEIVSLLESFRDQPATLMMPEIPYNSFAKKLYSTYLSYLPKEKVSFPLKMNVDDRGSFTELLRTADCGQVSVNISKPGITKGQHWHHTKWEFFIVVSGKGLIQLRKIGTDEVLNYEVSGDKIEAVHMLPGYTHNIINLSDTEDLVTVMWANEPFDPGHPDTFFEKVEE